MRIRVYYSMNLLIFEAMLFIQNMRGSNEKIGLLALQLRENRMDVLTLEWAKGWIHVEKVFLCLELEKMLS